MDPRRLANAPESEKRDFLIEAVLADTIATEVLKRAHAMGMPDWALMAGAVYQAVWNALTGRKPGYGVNDYDLAYCDPSDLTEDGEDAMVARAAKVFGDLSADVEICNQARVHIWFSRKNNVERKPLLSTEGAVREFASLTHCVAIRLDEAGRPEVIAPYGLGELFSLDVKPSPWLSTPDAWNAKIAVQKEKWPEVSFYPAVS